MHSYTYTLMHLCTLPLRLCYASALLLTLTPLRLLVPVRLCLRLGLTLGVWLGLGLGLG